MAAASTVELFVRLGLSMVIVLGLMMVLAHVMRRRGIGGVARASGTVDLEVVARKGLGRNASIAVVRAGDRAFVLGVTEQQVNRLADLDAGELDLVRRGARSEEEAHWTGLPGAADRRSGPAWKAMLDGLRERTVRRT